MSPRRKLNLNGRGPVTNQSGATASGGPNVCKTPIPGGPPVPLPYPSAAESKDLTGYDPSVKVGGGYVFTTNGKLKRSRGDEPGTANGILSNKRGSEVELLTSSSDVKIGGSGVGRHADMTWQNAKNTIGQVRQGTSATSEAEIFESEDETENEDACKICSSSDCTPFTAQPHGNHLRIYDKNPWSKDAHEAVTAKTGRKSLSDYRKSIRDRIRETYNSELGRITPGKDLWEGHPWAPRPGSLQGHHLIDCAALKSDALWALICWNFGYDVNDKENGAMLPCRPEISCALILPLHRGSHDTAVTYDKEGNKVRRADAPALTDSQIDDLLRRNKTGKKDKGGQLRKKAVADIYLCYPDAVIDLIATTLDAAKSGAFCQDHKGFIEEMNQISTVILNKLKTFSWTLTAEGRRFIRDGEGCCASAKTNTEISNTVNERQLNHCTITSHAARATFNHHLSVGR